MEDLETQLSGYKDLLMEIWSLRAVDLGFKHRWYWGCWNAPGQGARHWLGALLQQYRLNTSTIMDHGCQAPFALANELLERGGAREPFELAVEYFNPDYLFQELTDLPLCASDDDEYRKRLNEFYEEVDSYDLIRWRASVLFPELYGLKNMGIALDELRPLIEQNYKVFQPIGLQLRAAWELIDNDRLNAMFPLDGSSKYAMFVGFSPEIATDQKA